MMKLTETVMRELLAAAEEVNRKGAVTGPQWTKLTSAIIKARAVLKDATTTP